MKLSQAILFLPVIYHLFTNAGSLLFQNNNKHLKNYFQFSNNLMKSNTETIWNQYFTEGYSNLTNPSQFITKGNYLIYHVLFYKLNQPSIFVKSINNNTNILVYQSKFDSNSNVAIFQKGVGAVSYTHLTLPTTERV